jgi:hypothetical protein
MDEKPLSVYMMHILMPELVYQCTKAPAINSQNKKALIT